MEPDKRQSIRKRTDQLLYAEFGPENGSILLNLSEQGCSFQSMAPVREQQLRFSVSVGDGRKLEGDGQMVWSDTAKKTGGLRFVNPSAELREKVREWLEETLVTADGKLDPGAVESKAKSRRKKLREEARAQAELARKEAELKAGEPKRDAESDTGAKTLGVETATNNPLSSTAAGDDQRFTEGTGRGVVAILLGAILLVTLVSYRRALGHLVMSFGSSLAGEEQNSRARVPVGANSVPETASQPVSEVQAAGASEKRETPNENGAEATPTAGEQLTKAADGRTAVAKRVSSPVSSQPSSQQGVVVEDVPSLWTSVENGDTRAEVILANRYVRGEGVPQSCAQARVLLEAAVKRGSTEAKQKLDDLGQAGCP